jgi:hypothetical protein
MSAKLRPPPAATTAPPAVRRIPQDAVFFLHELRDVLRLPASCLKREVRLRRLRAAKRSGRYIVTGRWVHEWIEGGEIGPRPAAGGGQKKEPPHSGVVRGGGEKQTA